MERGTGMSWYSDGEKPSQFTLIRSGDAEPEDFGFYEDEEDNEEGGGQNDRW